MTGTDRRILTNPLSKFDEFFAREWSVSMEMHRSDWVAIHDEIERLRGELGYIARLCPDPAWGDRAKRALGTAPEPGDGQSEIERLRNLLRAVQSDAGNWLHSKLQDAIEAEVGAPGSYRPLSDPGIPSKSGEQS